VLACAFAAVGTAASAAIAAAPIRKLRMVPSSVCFQWRDNARAAMTFRMCGMAAQEPNLMCEPFRPLRVDPPPSKERRTAMKRIALATAAIALLATPALAQYAQPYPGAYVRQTPPAYGQAYGYVPEASYRYAAPYGQFYTGGYSLERDYATEPDPNIRLQLKRDQYNSNGVYLP
jgi:hypothetical protein